MSKKLPVFLIAFLSLFAWNFSYGNQADDSPIAGIIAARQKAARERNYKILWEQFSDPIKEYYRAPDNYRDYLVVDPEILGAYERIKIKNIRYITKDRAWVEVEDYLPFPDWGGNIYLVRENGEWKFAIVYKYLWKVFRDLILLNNSIKKYFWEHNELPRSLNQLVPQMGSIPADIFNDCPDKQYKYIPRGKDWVIYSVGPDGDDDSGVVKYDHDKGLISDGDIIKIETKEAARLQLSGQQKSLKPGPVNVLLITIDSLRADHLGCYGYPRQTSPNIDNFSREGALFTQAVSQSTFTYASLPSIITSTYPFTHNVKVPCDTLVPDIVTLPEILQRNGYITGLISSIESTFSVLGLDRGFDLFTYHPAIDRGRRTEEKTTQDLIKWIKENSKMPFFFWVHFYGVHAPYNPPAPYGGMFVSDEFAKGDNSFPITDKNWTGFRGIPKNVAVDGITDLGYYISQYDAQLRYIDDQIGILLKELESTGMSAGTLVVITADHGEAFGEHERYCTHGGAPYEEVIRVPLVIKYPPRIRGGALIHDQVELIDIMPTILDILKIKKPASLEGTTLLPLLAGKKKARPEFAFSNIKADFSIRTKKWKLLAIPVDTGKSKSRATPVDKEIYYRYELYDLENDPREKTDLAGTEKKVFLRMERELTSRVAKGAESAGKKVDEERREQLLRSLSYLQ